MTGHDQAQLQEAPVREQTRAQEQAPVREQTHAPVPDPPARRPRPSGTGRLLSGVAWTVLLLGLWLWGREAGDVPPGLSGPATGDMAAAGRP
ncbi:hypothetical protein N4P33_33880, partial [Streptomyces sp. 15-116A]|nr:hypothetical protein [Streptomyces sp. 15-116A]